MQVLKDSNKICLSYCVHLPTSFYVCLWFSHSSKFHCPTLAEKPKNKQTNKQTNKHASADFKPAKPVLQVFPDPAGRRGWAPLFSSPVVSSQGRGLSPVCNTHRYGGPIFLPAPSKHCGARTAHSAHVRQVGAGNPPGLATL